MRSLSDSVHKGLFALFANSRFSFIYCIFCDRLSLELFLIFLSFAGSRVIVCFVHLIPFFDFVVGVIENNPCIDVIEYDM